MSRTFASPRKRVAAALLTIAASTAGVAFGAHHYIPGGADSTVLAAATGSGQPALVQVSSPVDGGAYGPARWNEGCDPVGICGTASDPLEVAKVEVAIKRESDGHYWNGSGFSGPTVIFIQADGQERWSYPFGLPADGDYAVSARVTNGLGGLSVGSGTSVRFTADNVAPSIPTIVEHPEPSTYDTAATFAFSAGEDGGTFRCSLNGSPDTPCPNPKTYEDVPLGDHVFEVAAVDAAGNASPFARFEWTILTRLKFTVAGDAASPFVPGSSQPVDLTVSNPYDFPLRVTAVTVAIGPAATATGNPVPGCGTENLVLTRDFQGPVVVPANSKRSLSSLGVAQDRWPVLTMPDLDVNQDACKHAVFPLTYTGTGTKTS